MNKISKFLADKCEHMVNVGIFFIGMLAALYIGVNIIDNAHEVSDICNTQSNLLNTTYAVFVAIWRLVVATLAGLLGFYLFTRRE